MIEETTNEKSVILDPTGHYEIPQDHIAITTEVDWIKSFFITEGQYWIKGERLCNWTKEWLRVWNKTKAIKEIKQEYPAVNGEGELEDSPKPSTEIKQPEPTKKLVFIEGFNIDDLL